MSGPGPLPSPHLPGPPFRRYHQIVLTESWKSTLDTLCGPLQGAEAVKRVVAVVGPKGAGKSTFARELFARVVRLLGEQDDEENGSKKKRQRKQDECAFVPGFLDTDLGRPDLTLPGIISVHNGAYQLKGAIFLGEDDPSQRPEDYLNAVKAVGSLAHELFNFIVVNTHGWVSGLGQDILEAILINTGVTDVVQIVPENKMTSLGSLIRPSESFRVWTLTPAKEHGQRESKSSRERRFFDHFLKGQMHAVGMANVRIVYPFGMMDRDLPQHYAMLALNTSLVGLLTDPPEDPRSFLGVGLVCAIDMQSQSLFIQSKLNFERIKHCTTLVMATSARVPLAQFPANFQPNIGEDDADVGFEGEDDDEQLIPYITTCKLVGYGTFQMKAPLKRRRYEGDGGN